MQAAMIGLESEIKTLKTEMVSKEDLISDLTTKLFECNQQVASLNVENTTRQDEIFNL